MAESIDVLSLRTAQQNQILKQFRASTYNDELRFSLLLKILEEKKILVPGEFDNRWPMYLKNEVGVVGPDGVMEGNLIVHWYGEG